MKAVVAYLLALLAALVAMTYFDATSGWLSDHPELHLATRCSIAGAFGGVTYCLRGIYLSVSVRKDWDPTWLTWFFLRPFVSAITGTVSYVFIRAGLLVLEASRHPDATTLGFLALAFIAGLNVDRFITRLEDLARAAWGIRPSRTAEASEKTGT